MLFTKACIGAAIVASTITPTLGDIGPGECDGERPQFEADEYSLFGGGQVAVGTQWRSDDLQGVLNVYDLTAQGSAPLGANWPTNLYSHPDWVRSQMGQVFGVTLDDQGNIFAAHTAIYGLDLIGAIGATPGQIYKIDSVTGTPTVFATLPNDSAPLIAASPFGVNESYPGLGNLHFDVGKQMVYVSNFEDGRIYRIDALGTCLSTWDHATGIVSDCAPEAGDAPGAAPLGERVWAVGTFNGRVYYSIWHEDNGAQSPIDANEIWSVAYDAAGEFIGGTEQLEISVPVYALEYSNPVADIAFSESGAMMLAERSMQTDLNTRRFTTLPHQSRALEYVCDAQQRWIPSPNIFQVGSGIVSADSAGGCDYSYAAAPDDRVWVTGDALLLGAPTNVYGIQGLPQSGGGVPNSILIDMDADIIAQDKSGLGSVEISCPGFVQEPCATITNEEILCDLDNSGNYTLTFDLTNNSGQDVAHLLVLPGAGYAVVPSGVITLPSILVDGATTTVSITFTGGLPGDDLCFTLSLNTVDFQECCSIQHCITVPDCSCAQIHKENTVCTSDGAGCFTYSFDVDNLLPVDIYHSFFIPISPAGVTIDTGNIDPSRWDFAPIPSLGTESISLTICGANPGEIVCFTMTMHTADLAECCSIEVCVTVPDCAIGTTCPADMNNDGLVNFFDISVFLSAFTSGDPIADINSDGNFDFFDVSEFLALFAQGCP